MADDPKPLIDPAADIENVVSFFTSGGPSGGKLGGFLPDHLKSLSAFTDWVAEWGVARPLVLFPMYFGMFAIVASLVPGFPALIWGWIIATLPIWAPITSVAILWPIWVWYVRSLYLATVKTILLEVKMPKEITKSPRAMEVALNHLWTTGGETTFIDRYWKGSMRAFFSLEMAAFDGEVHFYIWGPASAKDLIETTIYGQYPEVEIVEAEDYATRFVYDPSEYDMFANDQILEADPTGIQPIRSYVDFELDKDPKEEHKVEPFGQVVELFSSLRASEQAWVQIIITSNKGGAEKRRLKDTEERVKEIRREASVNPGQEHLPDDDPEKYGFPRPTWRQNELIYAIERHMGKRNFNTGIRLCYIAKFQDYRPEIRSAIRWLYLPFTNRFSNYLRPRAWHGPFDYPWQDFGGVRWQLTTRRFLDAYRRRSWFYPPWITPDYFMSTESLASIWHPPSSTVASPGLQRIPSKKSSAPPNLPL